MGALQITVFFSLMLQAPAWTVAGLGLSATAAGLVKLPSNVTSVFAGPLGGWLTGRGGGRIALIAGGLITTLGWLLVLVDASSVPVIIAELIVISFGTTMLFAVAPSIIAAAAPPERTSEASGMLGVIRALFMGVGAQIVATLLATGSVTQGAERYPSPDAYNLTVAVIAGLTLAATLVALLLPRGRPSQLP
jgi:MFS family permease